MTADLRSTLAALVVGGAALAACSSHPGTVPAPTGVASGSGGGATTSTGGGAAPSTGGSGTESSANLPPSRLIGGATLDPASFWPPTGQDCGTTLDPSGTVPTSPPQAFIDECSGCHGPT